jgi:hypothetical protein
MNIFNQYSSFRLYLVIIGMEFRAVQTPVILAPAPGPAPAVKTPGPAPARNF